MKSLIDVARRVLQEHRNAQDGRDASVVHLPSQASLDLSRLLAVEFSERADQIIAVSNEGLNPEGFEHVVWREAANSGRECRRIYLIPHAGFAATTLDVQLKTDRDNGIDSRFVIVSRIPFDSQLMNCENLWIIDGSTVVISTSDSMGRDSHSLTITGREADVRNAQNTWDRMWQFAVEDADELACLDLEEPLVLTADLLNGVAPVLCTRDHVDETGCDWYHGTWQYLRLLQLVSTPTWHHEFYRTQLADALCGEGSAKALITGTADYSMLAYLANASQEASCNCEIHVVDQCATPLFACKWYAKRNGFELCCHEQDVLELRHQFPGEFRLICTDAFLTRFSPEETLTILKLWYQLLAPGGRVVTTVRVHSRALVARPEEAAVSDFRERAVERANRWDPFLRKSAVEISELAEIYARTMVSTPIGDDEQIKSLFREAGFELLHTELGDVPGELYPTIYLRIACEKKAE